MGMTRMEVLGKYDVADGVIKTKGQFEGQAIYIPHFWSIYLMGEAHEVGSDVVQFTVLGTDRIQFPELGSRQVVRLRPNGIRIEEA